MAKTSLLSGTIDASFLSKRGVTVRPHSWLRKLELNPTTERIRHTSGQQFKKKGKTKARK